MVDQPDRTDTTLRRVTIIAFGSVTFPAYLLGGADLIVGIAPISQHIVFGIAGYALKKIDIQPAPIVLALILGYLTETNFRRALLASADDPTVFLSSPVSVACLLLSLGIFLLPFIRSSKTQKAQPAAEAA